MLASWVVVLDADNVPASDLLLKAASVFIFFDCGVYAGSSLTSMIAPVKLLLFRLWLCSCFNTILGMLRRPLLSILP